MAYTKYSLTPANNTNAPPDGAPEGMLPSGVNDTMRDMMAQIRDCGDGIRGGTYTMTAVVITGGSITGITDLAVADGGTGASTLTGVLKGNGTSAFTAATAGTDYLAPPSGTAILKANSGGALANATAGTDYAGIATAQSFTAAQRGAISGLTDGTTITPDFALANNYSVTLAGNRTLANPTNITAGQSGSIFISQDGTGSRTLAYGTYYDFIGGTAPTLSTAASSVDRIDYVVRTSTSIHAVFTASYS
jgi:hypothetical protein